MVSAREQSVEHRELTEFIAAFKTLKSRVNGKSRNMGWMARNSADVLALVKDVVSKSVDLDGHFAKLAKKDVPDVSKAHIGLLREFKHEWLEPASSISQRAFIDAIESGNFLAELDLKGGGIGDGEAPMFDPLVDSAADYIDELFDFVSYEADPETEDGEIFARAFDAWDWFKRIGLDLSLIEARWGLIEPVLVPPHVTGSSAFNTKRPLLGLHRQAVQAYVFGAPSAAIALCRALTDLILREHYGCDGKDENGRSIDLKEVIRIAENRPTSKWIMGHSLQEKRTAANRVLHEFEPVDQSTVVEWLSSLKELIERAPERHTKANATPPTS